MWNHSEKLVLQVLHFMSRHPKVSSNVVWIVIFSLGFIIFKYVLFYFFFLSFIYSFLMMEESHGIPFTDNWQELIQQIRSKGMKPGVALKPGTPVEDVYPLVRSYSLS
ncbi:hypothetical protein CsSME_00004637 [Camellia sinensis var. sinensis]